MSADRLGYDAAGVTSSLGVGVRGASPKAARQASTRMAPAPIVASIGALLVAVYYVGLRPSVKKAGPTT